MAKLDKLANGNGFDGICHSVEASEFNQYDISIQLVDDSADLSLCEMRFGNVFHHRHNIKQFHRILQSRSM